MEQLYGFNVVLRPLSYQYIQGYLLAFTQEVRMLLHVPDMQTEYQYLLNRIPLIAQRRTFFYCIFDKFISTIIGALEIRGSEHPGQLYTWLRPDYWGKNYFQEALFLAQRFYFSQINSLYFTARTDIDNQRSYKALKKAGFADYAIVQGSYALQYELILVNNILSY